MAVNLGDKPLADFTQPIEMMTDCHRRIEHFLSVLGKVEKLYGDRELDEEARGVLQRSLEYFACAAPNHTSDEELSLFPRMRTRDEPAIRDALAELDGLEQQHRRAEVCHGRVDELGRQWLSSGRLDAAARSEFIQLLEELSALYATHIRLEEDRVFVLASRLLNEDELRQIGAEMRRRRVAANLAGP